MSGKMSEPFWYSDLEPCFTVCIAFLLSLAFSQQISGIDCFSKVREISKDKKAILHNTYLIQN